MLCASVSCIGVVKLFGPVQGRSLLLQAGSRVLEMKRHLETEQNNDTACNCFLHLRTSRHATWHACKNTPCSKSRECQVLKASSSRFKTYLEAHKSYTIEYCHLVKICRDDCDRRHRASSRLDLTRLPRIESQLQS